jgi:hypothetical protein
VVAGACGNADGSNCDAFQILDLAGARFHLLASGKLTPRRPCEMTSSEAKPLFHRASAAPLLGIATIRTHLKMRSWLARGSTLWNTRFAIPQSLPRHLAGVNLASSILRVPPAVCCTLPFSRQVALCCCRSAGETTAVLALGAILTPSFPR